MVSPLVTIISTTFFVHILTAQDCYYEAYTLLAQRLHKELTGGHARSSIYIAPKHSSLGEDF